MKTHQSIHTKQTQLRTTPEKRPEETVPVEDPTFSTDLVVGGATEKTQRLDPVGFSGCIRDNCLINEFTFFLVPPSRLLFPLAETTISTENLTARTNFNQISSSKASSNSQNLSNLTLLKLPILRFRLYLYKAASIDLSLKERSWRILKDVISYSATTVGQCSMESKFVTCTLCKFKRNAKEVDGKEISYKVSAEVKKTPEMHYSTRQTRSADEGQTTHYLCPRCDFLCQES
ncbi:hypothetical protein LWI28_001008 [Acer negundo]|uniref:TFIIS-type domain-containing protein n=1 Tax=Acer negundo TaxID=4023 RepID=A0AAD5P6D6_ACENE|nr:hypothetical protein LWI28_001008 [Acer negundo]